MRTLRPEIRRPTTHSPTISRSYRMASTCGWAVTCPTRRRLYTTPCFSCTTFSSTTSGSSSGPDSRP
ncbi:hypothetical protein DPMN_127001 [Dreissena polymorpha]|uniref:Uncharacterized protein n=1 Tax=Dreissena polymorpha TaxID=45954 RepID=A0A9D4GY54_DREPO|nr:hypothetical protein DPMN_127001 [Dreissena polymorpha]